MEPKDYRILLAEKGVEEIKKLSNSLRILKRKEFIAKIEEISAKLQTVKYSYMPAEEVAKLEEILKISEISSKLRKEIQQRDLQGLTADYWLEYLENLPELMKRGEIMKIYEAIRFFSGDVLSKRKLDRLWLCLFDCGFKLEVVTNSEALAVGRRVVAYLPPRKFGEVISRGMFVEATLEKKGELSIEEIRKISRSLGEVEALLISLLSSKG
ncbi:MAG: RNA-binding protein [Archaeoglobaceae archaeon]|nr:RNA-binding protein [Archaeoglobaceae archaeon]MDW8127938.1 RNA-binding protein [Archaeoglobaceae archaeon]